MDNNAPVASDDAAQVNEAAPEEPVQSEATEVQEQPVSEEQSETQAPLQEQQVNEGAEAPQGEEQLPEDSEFDPSQYANLYQQPAGDVPTLEDGSVDPVAWKEQLKNEMREEMRFERQETRQWQKIEKKYGDQLTPTRRKLILNSRVAAALEGKGGSLDKLADEVMAELNSSKSQGRAEAVTSRKVQKAVGLETATQNAGSNKNDEVYERISSGDDSAAEDLLSQWLEKGKI